MKYFDTLIEDQETTISILYKEQMIKIYSSVPETIQRLVKVLGQPTVKYKKSKTYWSGASWDVDFFELEKLKEILYRDTFIDKKLKPLVKEEKKALKKEKKDGVNTKKEITEKSKNEKSKPLSKVKKELKVELLPKSKKNENKMKVKPKSKKINISQKNLKAGKAVINNFEQMQLNIL